MSPRTEHRALLTGALSLSVVLSGCAAAGSRNEVVKGRDDTKHAMMDLVMCDPCCGAVLRLLKIGAPASELSSGAHPARNELGAATTSRMSNCEVNEPPD